MTVKLFVDGLFVTNLETSMVLLPTGSVLSIKGVDKIWGCLYITHYLGAFDKSVFHEGKIVEKFIEMHTTVHRPATLAAI